MGRWQPNARERFVDAAIALFDEQGYESTTVAQIAERTGLTKTTFFRHFGDKRDVLFAGEETIAARMADGVASAPPSATPLEAVAAGLDAATALHTQEHRDRGPRLHALIAGSAELQERAAFKRHTLTVAMADALHERGVAEPTAGLAAELGVRAYYAAFDHWSTGTGDETLGQVTRETLGAFRAAAAALG